MNISDFLMNSDEVIEKYLDIETLELKQNYHDYRIEYFQNFIKNLVSIDILDYTDKSSRRVKEWLNVFEQSNADSLLKKIKEVDAQNDKSITMTIIRRFLLHCYLYVKTQGQMVLGALYSTGLYHRLVVHLNILSQVDREGAFNTVNGGNDSM